MEPGHFGHPLAPVREIAFGGPLSIIFRQRSIAPKGRRRSNLKPSAGSKA
jgi:hypothetical protein